MIHPPNWLQVILVTACQPNKKCAASLSTCALLLWYSIASAQGCYESSIVSPSPFMGNDGEVFKLADGSVWQVKYEYEYMYEYYPSVIACPGRGKMVVGDTTLNVQLLTAAAPKTKSHGINGVRLD